MIRMASAHAKKCRKAIYGNFSFDFLSAEETSVWPSRPSSMRGPVPLDSDIKPLAINSFCEPVGTEL
jgi:hypothetical protein